MEEKSHRNLLKRKASETNEVPSKIIRNCAAERPNIAQTRTGFNAQKSLIKRVREKQLCPDDPEESLDDFQSRRFEENNK